MRGEGLAPRDLVARLNVSVPSAHNILARRQWKKDVPAQHLAAVALLLGQDASAKQHSDAPDQTEPEQATGTVATEASVDAGAHGAGHPLPDQAISETIPDAGSTAAAPKTKPSNTKSVLPVLPVLPR